MNLSKTLFWDVNYETIDWDKHARFVIARVLMKGTLQDWFKIKQFYGLEKIKNEMLTVRYLDKITLNFCSSYFDLPKKQFRCSNTDQSIQKLWSY